MIAAEPRCTAGTAIARLLNDGFGEGTYERRLPGTVPPAPQYLLAAAVRARRYLSRPQSWLLVDPQVMPRRLRIAPRLIVLDPLLVSDRFIASQIPVDVTVGEFT